MKLKFDFSAMSTALVGEHGISSEDIKNDNKIISDAFNKVIENKGKNEQEWSNLPFQSEELIKEIEDYAAHVRKKADALVVFGIGGSALGTKAVAWSLLHLNHNHLKRRRRDKAPKIYVEDNIDPEGLNALLEIIDLKKTYFNFVSKSGETCETLSQFLLIYNYLKKELGKKKAKERIIITTSVGSGSLYDVALKEGFKIFNIPKGVGGRFSVLSTVGLVPLAIVGIDIRMLLKGAAEMDASVSNPDIYKNPALFAAYAHYKGMKNGKNISVMMPYSEALKFISDFYAQLWAESLGKALSNDGQTINVGQTPVKALGVIDQHSQIQLYTEGPFDKIVTILAVEEFRDGLEVPTDTEISDFAYLKGHTFSNIMHAERKATAYALTKAKRCNYTIYLPCVCEYTIGELLTYFMYQTTFAAAMINVNPFNQPGVEEGKKATYGMLGRVGYEDFVDEVDKFKIDEFKIS